jgi:hypothetical protein
MRVSRRRFLQVGIAGSALLAGSRLLRAGAPASETAPIEALANVILDGALPAAGAERAQALRETAEAFQRAVSGLSPAVRGEVEDLLGLLRWYPTRYPLTGLASALEASTPAEIAAFLESWRRSRFDLLRAGYQALTQLVQAGWYDNPRAWAAIGYPGPPALGTT